MAVSYVGKLFLDVFREPLFLQIVERVGSHDSEIDSLKKQNVGDALDGTAAHNWEDAQLISVVEHGGQVGAKLDIGAADGAGYQRHRVGVQALLGLHRSELEYRLEAFADLCRVKLPVLGGLGREATSHRHGDQRQSK